MHTLNKWIRQVHRWLAIPLLLALLSFIVGTLQGGETFKMPDWLNIIALVSLLSLLLTGVYLFAQYYWAKWRRAK